MCVEGYPRRSGDRSWMSSRISDELCRPPMISVIVDRALAGNSVQVLTASVSAVLTVLEGSEEM